MLMFIIHAYFQDRSQKLPISCLLEVLERDKQLLRFEILLMIVNASLKKLFSMPS